MRHRWFLIAAILVGGSSSLGIELTASRLLQPYFGSSQVIWANVIGLTLIYLTIGYQLGGRLADRRPETHILGRILLAAGLTTAPIPLIARPILQWSATAFQTSSMGVFFGSFLGMLVLCSVPIVLLGMVAPFAIRLSIRDVRTAGNTAGTLYALSTLGSIVGTFLPVLVLIPAVGIRMTFYIFALALVTLGALGIGRRAALAAVPTVIALAVVPLGVRSIREPFWAERGCVSLYETETTFNDMQIARLLGSSDGLTHIGLILNDGQAFPSLSTPRCEQFSGLADLVAGGPWDFSTLRPTCIETARRTMSEPCG